MKYPQLVSMPSAVSDWLEEQLDARGIDAVVYTRYVLSLLHRDSQDLLVSDQDLQGPKEVSSKCGRGGRNKRFRRPASSWWGHVVRADVEQLRRSAAVECLMSAAEQKCGIESLVDELCEKLKHIEGSAENASQEVPSATEPSTRLEKPKATASPTDLARRYYAAFPPLSHKPQTASLISLLPQICSPATAGTAAVAAAAARRRQCKDRPPRKDETMKARGGKKKGFLSRRKKDFGFARSLEKQPERSDACDWDLHFLSRADEGYSTSDTTGVDESEDAASEMEHDSLNNIDEGNLAKLVAKFDQRIEALWSSNTEEVEQNAKNEYQDLPVDIQELLASPTNEVEILNVVNKRATDKTNKSFIQCGTNITSSIWTANSENEDDRSLYDSVNYCNFYNESLESYPEKNLGDQFNSLSVATEKSDEFFTISENETNLLYENLSKEINNIKFGLKNDFASLPWELTLPSNSYNNKWSDAESYSFINENVDTNLKRNKAVNESLITLNHNKEASCFTEVIPKQDLGLPSLTPKVPVATTSTQPQTTNKEEEDLLTSTRTHFRPIKQESLDTSNGHSGHYADGTTFAIRNSLEHVAYRRSESGNMYVESGFDSPKKYMEYRSEAENREFVLKFCVKQNEKCCQTEVDEDEVVPGSQAHSPLEVPAKKRVLCDPEEFFFPGDEELLSDSGEAATECSCTSRERAKLATNLEPLFQASAEACGLHGRDSTVAEINWGPTSSGWRKCDKCNNNWSSWGTMRNGGGGGDINQAWQQIWSSSEELCRTCLGVPAGSGPPPGRTLQYFRLREELSEDGEQLLSDLSCVQRVFMERLSSADLSEFMEDLVGADSAPDTAWVCNVVPTTQPKVSTVILGNGNSNSGSSNGAATTTSGSKERKRRHSSSQRVSDSSAAAAVARNSWTNTSCLRPEMRRFFTPPLLRPVTL